MKPNPIATRALAGMLPAMALFATPAMAQDAAQPAAVPPPTVVVPTPPAPAAAEPAAPTASTGPSAEDRAKFEASATAATGTAASAAEAAPAAETRRAPTRPGARAAAAPARVVRAPAAPVAAAPAALTPAPVASAPAAPVAAAPLPDAPMTTPVPDEPTAAATTATDAATTQTTTESGGMPVWGWVLGAIAILGAIAAFVGLRRRREETVWDEETVYEEPAYVEPVAAAPIADAPIATAPLAAAPLAAAPAVVEDHAEVVTPAADDVAAITAASAPVTGRPWIELSLRPLRADATSESAIVDLELTLANAGEVEARDVRVSTFMLGDANAASSDLEHMLANGHGGTEVSAGQIGAGEGSRVDATLAVARDGLEGPTYQPIVVADVRYTLPGGGEGRTAAAFAVGVNDGTDEPTPLRLGDVREDVSATLHGVLERA